MGYIYKITNNQTNKVYIGQTIDNVQNRWKEHIREAYDALDGIRKSFPLFHRMIIKYGAENFKVEEIEQISNELLDSREKYWISYYQSNINGYNSTCGGNYGKYTFQYRGQKVTQFDLQGNFIKTYKNAQEAADAVKVDVTNIRKNCNTDSKTCANYIWQWGENVVLNKPIESKNRGGRSPVLQFDKKGNFLNEYSTIAAAARAVNGNSTAISNACNGRSKSSKGYIWKYKFDKK